MPASPFSRRGRRLAGALLLCSALLACTDDSTNQARGAATPTADPCVFDGDAETVLAECVPDPGAPPGESPPATSAAIEPVRLPPAENELARAANDEDPSLTEASFEVTVPAGGRLRSTVACNGAGTTQLTTEPDSGARQEFACSYGNGGVELTVTAATPVSQAQTYRVSFTAGAPARWSLVLSYATGSPDADRVDG